jgi:site-specific recombinase XerC
MTISAIDTFSEPSLGDETPRTRRPRRKGVEGSLRRLESGRWQARLPVRLGGASLGTYKTDTEASRALRRATTRIEDGRQGRPTRGPRRTVADVVAAYLDASVDRLAANTIIGYRGDLARRIRPYPLGQIAVTSLTTPDVARWRDALVADGFKTHTRRTAKALLQVAYAWEAERHHLPSNPVAALRRPVRTKRSTAEREGAASRRAQIPTWETLAAVLRAIPRREDRLVLTWGGPRLAEAAALELDRSLHPTRPALLINRVIVRGLSGWEEEPPKTGRSREVPLPTPLWEALISHRRSIDGNGAGPWGCLFPARTRSGRTRGGPGIWTSRGWTDAAWSDAVSAAGAGGLIVKRLRAYAATILVASGATVTEAQTLLGHASLATTFSHYLVAEETISRDPDIAAIRAAGTLSREDRLNRLWSLWVERHGDPLSGAV